MPAPLRMKSDPNSGPALATPSSLVEAFESEAKSNARADRSEMIRSTVEALVADGTGQGEISEIDCRRSHCLLRIAGGDEPGVVALVSALQDERGFYGKAESLLLARDESSIRIYLRFGE